MDMKKALDFTFHLARRSCVGSSSNDILCGKQ